MSLSERWQHGCPSEEEWAAYLGGIATLERQRALDRHLEQCDACLELLLAASRRWARDREMDMVLPAHASETVPSVPPAAPAASERPPRVRAPRRSRLPLPRKAWWFGSALAAGLVLVTVQVWQLALQPGAQERATRAVPVGNEVRVAAARAEVRAAPHPRADVVATLRRGETVRVGAQERDWYRVQLADGREGWIVMEALR